MSPLPELEYIGHNLVAGLYRVGANVVLACDNPPGFAPDEVLRAHGPLVIRYALPYLYSENAIVPGLFASEYGALLVGREAWDYTMTHNNLHPRADLLGMRTDGQRDQVMLRELDFGRGVEVWAYASQKATQPLMRVTALQAATSADLPDLLLAYLPRLPVQR